MSKYAEDEIQWSDDEKLFNSPIAQKKGPSSTKANGKAAEPSPSPSQAQSQAKPRQGVLSQEDAADAREAALQQELDNVRKINNVIESVVESLDKAKGNMENVSHTVSSASTLLTTWTRILSQTEHNQRLILNPSWQGATQDLSSIEAEEHQRARDAQRRHYEEQARREAAARKAEEDERRREDVAARGARGRGRGRASSGYGLQRPASSTATSRGGSNSRTPTAAGRGVRGSRGRGTT